MLDLSRVETPESVDDFKRVVGSIHEHAAFRKPLLWAIGTPVLSGGGSSTEPVSYRFPVVNGPGEHLGSLALLQATFFPERQSNVVRQRIRRDTVKDVLRMFTPFQDDKKKHRNRDMIAATDERDALELVVIYDDADPEGVDDATLKLYSLSNRHFRPNTLNLKGVFKKLPDAAWVGDTPYLEDEVEQLLMRAAIKGKPFSPHMVDRFPLYTHRINAQKMDVRITDQHKVRLGAYLGKGTVLMPGASYINFNAGTEGPAMIEGRVSSSAFVGAGTDLGGGSSMLGTLSGGNETPISLGRNCLLEVNSTLGIPLGDCCILSGNTSLLAGSKVYVDHEGHRLNGQSVKAIELAGVNGYTFRRDDESGQLVMVRTKRNIAAAKKLDDDETILNEDLH